MIIGTNIIETRVEVTLADIGPLERPYSNTRIIPTAMTVTYRTGDNIYRGAPWHLYGIELRGAIAKKDGSPSLKDTSAHYHPSARGAISSPCCPPS